MPETKTIELFEPIPHHGVEITRLDLKEPSGGLYAKLGEPRVAVRTADGGGYWVEQPEVIKAYLDRLIVHQDGAILLGLMNMADAMQLKEALFSFFAVAEAKIIAQRVASSSSAKSA